MDIRTSRHSRIIRLAALPAVFVLAVVLVAVTLGPAQAQGGGPDLIVEVSLNPPSPAEGEQTEINLVVRNVGGVNIADTFRVYLYVDPADQPPKASTPGFPFQTPGLQAGKSYGANITRTFTGKGCNHVVYAWVDRDDVVSESDESNNLTMLPVCVGVTCEVDAYESDNSCSDATWQSSGARTHSLCHAADPQLADQDWIKFTAFAGVTYTLSTANIGTHIQPEIALYEKCGASQLSGPTESLSWLPVASGVYYAKIDSATGNQGPLTAYDLTLDSDTGVTDSHEPDDSCPTAQELVANGASQTHRFQAPQDVDWIKFSVKGGESFVVATENTGPNVKPQIEIVDSCDIAFGIQTAEGNAPTDKIYYAKLSNQNADIFGADAVYDIAVVTSDCTGDPYEEDDSPADARSLAVGTAARPADSRNFCPGYDEDWLSFSLKKEKVYVLETTGFAAGADTVLTLFDSDQTTELAANDDYGYLDSSRLAFRPAKDGVYYARARHHTPASSGDATRYGVSLLEGVCVPDTFDTAPGDNGPGDAKELPINASAQNRNFCADPLRGDLGDQDWMKLDVVAGGTYQVRTSELGANVDTVLEVYRGDGANLVARGDDTGLGQSSIVDFTGEAGGSYFVRATQFNSTILGAETSYKIAFSGSTPTPTPSPTPTPLPTPTPRATADPDTVRTVIVVNSRGLKEVHGAADAGAVMAKVFALADHTSVVGAVLDMDQDTTAAAAYTEWTTDQTALQDNEKANAVSSAIRTMLAKFLPNAPNVRYVILVGDDRVVPFRRVPDLVQPGTAASSSGGVQEAEYAPDVTADTTVAAALAENMILTDDYYVSSQAETWTDKQGGVHEVYLPDSGLSISRLIEEPAEINGQIETFLADQTITIDRALVTGWDFVQDTANTIATVFSGDTVDTDSALVGNTWARADLIAKHLNATDPFAIQSINGHSTHTDTLLPKTPLNEEQQSVSAAEVAAATGALAGTLIYNVGCHAGLNDPGALDLPQAFVGQKVTYVGNTGYGWGGSGSVLSEKLLRLFTVALLSNTRNEIGPSLTKAKRDYFSSELSVNAFDAKILMQMTLFGLPMIAVESSATFDPTNPFPSAEGVITPPTSFGGTSNTGKFAYTLPDSTGAFGESNSAEGQSYDLDGAIVFGDAEPVQPLYYANLGAPQAGELRGVLFTGGSYENSTGFDPVIALPYNEYVTETAEPTFGGDGWYPPTPFTVRALPNPDAKPGDSQTVVMSLGQFSNQTQTERLYSNMTFDTLYSDSADVAKPTITFVDGVLDSAAGRGVVKVEAGDPYGIDRVVVAYTDGTGQWLSVDLDYREQAQKWIGQIPASADTRYFVQAADTSGNVAVADNKSRYYAFAIPLPFVQGKSITQHIFLPYVTKK